MRRKSGARCYTGRYAEISAQSTRYAGHLDGNMDFSSLEFKHLSVFVSVSEHYTEGEVYQKVE